jgi:hypothetical protein
MPAVRRAGKPLKRNAIMGTGRLTALQMEPAQSESKIEKLPDAPTGANPVPLSCVNNKIEEWDGRRQALVKEIAAMTAEAVSPAEPGGF